ncbi:MAG: hypothetical protein GQ574_22135 [Crocinitomix sp.]|nr:hypothetical protein [Crocinitomix sp.]
MKKIHVFGVFFLLIFMISCQSTSFFFNESENETYTELQIKSNGTFIEYVYFNVQDSLMADDYGNVIGGSYEQIGDTLFLVYGSVTEKSVINEVYLKKGNDLIKLEPITYSHHYLNMVFAQGKSPKLRALTNYESIRWREGF